MRILTPGHNCWRIQNARRAAFLVDGEAYFSAVRHALEQARHAVYILGWDIDSRLYLSKEKDDYPARLGDFLNELVHRRRNLHIYVLVWDFAMIYALEREWLPIYKLGWQTHRHLHFRMDGYHPPGASQHQKVVVIDDTVAFVGGMDLSKWRWDTPEHKPQDPRRVGPEGHLYPPYHDVQMVVEGDVAASLGELARERWERLTGERLPSPDRDHSPWPENITPDIADVPVAIARTFPQHAERDEVREVERLYEDSIRAARRYIYIENQYFTSRHIASLLSERLLDPHGPEVLLVLPKRSNGWLEQHTMDVLRAHVLRRLQQADRHHRLAIFYPDHPEVAPDYINVHDKVMVVDDEFVRVGSSNLSNRSMGLDSECDVAIEAAGDAAVRASIADFRHRLLSEHLETTPSNVAKAVRREGSLIRAVGSLRREGRTLMPLVPVLVPSADEWLPDIELIDPEHPVAPEELIGRLVGEEERKPARRRITRNVVIVLALLAGAAGLRFTPLGDWLDFKNMMSAVESVRTLPAAPLVVVTGYVVGGLIALPLNLLVVVTVLAFGPWQGFLYGMVGSLLSAAVTYGLGHMLGRDLVRRFAGRRINRLSRNLARRGILAMMIVRVIPVAPFSIVNAVAGASHIRFRDFALGTVFGLLPGIAAITVFVDRIAISLQNPQPQNFVVLAVVVILIVLAAMGMRRLLTRGAAGERVTAHRGQE